MDDGLSSPPPARETAVLPEGVKECPGEETARSKAIAFVSKFLRYFLLLGCVSAWQAMGMLLQSIESPPSFLSKKDRKPYKQYYFMTWCVHNGFLISLIVWYVLRTKYYNLTVTRAQFHRHLLIASSIGSCMSLMGTMMWYYSLDSTVLSANSAMFQTTPLFVFLFSIKLLGEAVTRSKVVAFLIFTVGITCVTVFTKSQVTGGDKQESTPGGYLLCLLSVLLYAGYEVFYAWQEKVLEQKNAATKAEPEERNEIMDSLLFVGMMGFFNLVLLWPGLFLVHDLGLEPSFEYPTSLVAGEIVGVTLAETIFHMFLLSGIAVTGPVFMAVGGILIIPLGYIVDAVKGASPHTLGNYVGCAFIVFGFLVIQEVPFTVEILNRLFGSDASRDDEGQRDTPSTKYSVLSDDERDSELDSVM